MFDGGEDGKCNGASFAEISKVFATLYVSMERNHLTGHNAHYSPLKAHERAILPRNREFRITLRH